MTFDDAHLTERARIAMRQGSDATAVRAYLQPVKTAKTAEKQKTVIKDYADRIGFTVAEWLTVSNFDALRPKDVLLVESLFRLGGDMVLVLRHLKSMLERGVIVHSCEDGVVLGEDLTAPILAYAFGLAADIGTKARSFHTKEGLVLCREAGKTVGRPRGVKNKHSRLEGRERDIADLLAKGVGKGRIANMMGVDYYRFRDWLAERPELTGKEQAGA